MPREVNDPLAEFDRQLRADLSIAPSPEFEARVRQRIAIGRGLKTPALPSRLLDLLWRRGLQTPAFLAAAAAIVVVAGAVMLLPREQVVVVDQPFPTAPANAAGSAREIASASTRARPEASARLETPPVPRTQRTRTARRTEHTAVASSRREPEVIVPPQQGDAIRRLVRAVNEGRVAAMAEPVDTVAGAPEELEIQPLVVEPVVLPGTDTRSGLSTVVRGL